MKKMSFQDKLFERLRSGSDRIAIEYGDREMTYALLEKRVHLAACWMIGNGIEKGDIIGIYLEDRIDFITLLLGILKAGCLFVPLDTAHPVERIKKMVETTRPQIIFSDQFHHNRLLSSWTGQDDAGFKPVIMNEDFYREAASISFDSDWDIEYNREDKIYIYFTSGSTGIPKAIVGKNKSLLHFIDWEIDTFGVDDTFRVSQLTTPAFDASLRDICVPLMAGGTICIPGNKDILTSSEDLVRWIDGERIHLMHCVPSLFRLINTEALEAESFKHLKYVLLSGEKINPFELENWYDTLGERIQLVNLYGPTETTMIKTAYFIQKEDVKKEKIPIGKPIKGARVIILDKNKQLCEPGMIGEIYIRTPYRTSGYYHDPQLNKERFIPNPFNNDPEDLIYKTGDLGVLAEDGNLFWLGRMDRQVKIRGVRVEPEEIEHHLAKHRSVKDAVVKTVPDPLRHSKAHLTVEERGEDEYICAYIIPADPDPGTGPGKKPGTWELREYLSRELPDYMIPSYFVYMEKLPLTINGKINRAALPLPKAAGTGDNYKAPRNDIEEKLTAIWAEVLDIEKSIIGIDGVFFELGGHSLNAVTMLAKIHKELNVKVPLASVFKTPTIKELAKLIKKTTKTTFISIGAVEKKEYYPLSSAQKRLFILQQNEPDSISYNISTILQVEGALDRDRMESCFRKLIQRHESLRTSFEIIRNEPVQKIHENVTFSVEYHDAESSGMVDDIIKKMIKPFDLTQAPLLKPQFIKVEENKHILVVDMHHIISDRLSHQILVEEFTALYDGESLPPLNLQYKDFAGWQFQQVQAGEVKKQEAYWLKEFEGEIPLLKIPTDFPGSEVQSNEGGIVDYTLSMEQSDQLRQLARAEKVTMFIVISTLYYVFLSKLSGQEDIIVGTVIAGRRHVDLESLIGMFVNTLALRNYPCAEKTFCEFLKEVNQRTLEAFENQDYQFEDLVQNVLVTRGNARNPLFDVMFTYTAVDPLPSLKAGKKERELTVTSYDVEGIEVKFDMVLSVVDAGGPITFLFAFSTGIFKEETIQRFIHYFIEVVSAVLENRDIQLKDIAVSHDLQVTDSSVYETIESDLEF
jgi:amino acid adenylation domain-containing protein